MSILYFPFFLLRTSNLVLQLIKSLKLKIQKLNETLQETSEVCRTTVEENNRLKQMVKLKVGHAS